MVTTNQEHTFDSPLHSLNSEELKEFGRYIHDENEMDFVGGDPFFDQSCNNEDIINEIELTVENLLIKYSLRPKIKDRFPSQIANR